MIKINKQVSIEDLITRQINFWDTSRKKSDTKNIDQHPNLTISCQTGSKGIFLAQKISERLNWKIFDKEIVDYISDNTHIHKNMVELFDQKTRREMDNLLSSLMNSHAMSNEMYIKHLAKIMVALGKYGHAIILGRGGNFILPDNMAFKIRMVENIDSRLENLAQFDEERSWTLKSLKKDDKERDDYIQHFFNEKINSPANYNLLINFSKTDIKTAEEIIINGLAAKFNLSETKLYIQE